MDLHALLLGGGHQWEGELPADECALVALTAAFSVSLPSGYLALLRLSDGGEAHTKVFPEYVRIWSARDAVCNNADYEIQQWLPGFIAFGDNGGPELVGLDTRGGSPYPVCAIPYVPMAWEDAIGVATDFEAFIGQLLPRDDVSS